MKDLASVRSAMFEDIFGGPLKASGAPELALNYAALSYGGMEKSVDRLGRVEGGIGAFVSGLGETSEFYNIRTTSTLASAEKVFSTSTGTIGGSRAASQLSNLLSTSPTKTVSVEDFFRPNNLLNVSFFYEKEIPERLAYATGFRPGTGMAPMVPVKQMISEFFHDLPLGDSLEGS
jgi:hypothetical protein